MAETVLLSLFVFQIKHYACDYLLQTANLIRYKGDYLHPGGLLHAGLHMVGSIPALLLITRIPWVIAILVFAELVIHYHTDYAKARIDRHLRLNDTSSLYWAIFGFDQFVHQLTYVGMIFGALRLAT